MNNAENQLTNHKPGSIWDPAAFNKQFDTYIEENKKNRLLQQKAKLHDVNEIVNKEPEPFELPINLFIKQLLDTWNKFVSNIIKLDFSVYNSNDFLNLGVTLIAFAILILLLNNIFG